VPEKTPRDPKARAAASAVVAGGAIAAAKLASDRASARRRQERPAFQLEPDETPREGVGRVAGGQLDLTISLLEQSGQGDGGEAVHEARKALKRLRALLRVARGVIGQPRYRHENVVLRDLGRTLSSTRDAQVLLDTLEALAARYAEVLREGTWGRLRESLRAGLADPHTAQPFPSATMVGVLSGTRERIASWPLPDSGGAEILAGGLADIYRRGRRAFSAAARDPTPERLHELRKRAKDLWHATQLLAPLGPKPMKELQQDGHRLSDLLGEDHDLAILAAEVARRRELLSQAEHELLAAVIAERQRALRGEALALAARLYRLKPKQLLARLDLA
jgi:CHAD domain-containing protein